MPNKFLFSSVAIPFGGFVSHPLLGRHAPSDPLVGPLFTLAHFHALWCSTRVSAYYIFPSLMDDTHIIGLSSTIHLTFNHFVFHLAFMQLMI
jgi:hypothetical protein